MNEQALSLPFEDMNAWPAKTGLPASLEEEFQQCQTAIAKLYTQADQAAIRNQTRHKIIAVLAALLGTGAVLLAIAHRSRPQH